MEQFKESPSLAHPGKRFQGQFIDGIISYSIGFLMFYLMSFVFNKDLSAYIGITLGLSYFLLSDGFSNGQSLGKRLLNIQVLDIKTQKPATFVQSIVRNSSSVVGLFDFIFIFFKPRRRLGDYLAATIVVMKKNDATKN